MKRYIHQFLSLVSGAAAMLLVFTACNEQSDLGLEILPGEDLINVENEVLREGISAYVFNEDPLVTSRSGTNLLGSINDPVFGNTTAHLGAQLRLTSFPTFGTNPVVDSTFLVLYYRVIYGDTLTTQNVKVYELAQGLDADQEYTQETDLKSMASDVLLGELDYVPTVKLDTVYQDTLYQYLKIPIDKSLGERFVTADSVELATNDAFLEFFKGFYFESQKVSAPGSGALVTLETVPVSSSGFAGSAFWIYYNNDENMEKEVEEQDTMARSFRITNFSARVSQIEHDYTGTPFEADLNQEVEQDEYIYVQPTGGLKTKIMIDDLTHWQDSANTAINKAELVFQVDTIASAKDIYALPNRLLLTYIDKKGEEALPVDYYFNSGFYDGYLRNDYTYHFNITQHLQRMINITDPEEDDYVGNEGFYLTTGRIPNSANRAVLEGTGQADGVKLIITYSKYLQ